MKGHFHKSTLLFITGLLLIFGTYTTVKAQFRIAPSSSSEDTITCFSGGEESIRWVDKRFTFLDNNTEAQEILNDIASYVEELSATIEMAPILRRSLSNAEACESDKGRRYILYNHDWLLSVYHNTGSKWAVYAIIAHELGHFVLNHHLRAPGSTPKLEKEADRYAGKLLARMGASLEQAQSAYRSEEMKKGQGPTHPPLSERLEEVKRGFEEAKVSAGGGKDSGSTDPTILGSGSEASSEARKNTTEAIPSGPVEDKDSVYLGGADKKHRFRFKAVVIDFNSKDKDLDKAADKATNEKGTHVWDNKYYYWTKKNAEDRLLLAWANLTGKEYSWVLLENINGNWFYKANNEGWEELERGERKTLTWNSHGQIINISLYAPALVNGWTAENVEYNFGYSN